MEEVEGLVAYGVVTGLALALLMVLLSIVHRRRHRSLEGSS